MGKEVDRLDLRCRSGSKDAVYKLQLEEVDGGFIVKYQNGRYGGTLTPGVKTKSPVTLEEARRIFEKVGKEKMTAQPPYVRMEGSGEGFQHVDDEMCRRQTGLVPQLLNDVPDGQLESLLKDDDFVGQMKADGERRMVRVTGDAQIGSNRSGLQVALPACVADSLKGVVCEADGEMVGSHLYLFDLLSLGARDLRGEDFETRSAVLESVQGKFGAAVTVLPLAVGEQQKRVLMDRTRELRQEGLVFKYLRAPYTPGRPNSGGSQLRFKHWKTCTVIVLGANKDKRSVRTAVLDESGRLVEVGSVTVPKNKEIPEADALLEVRYLYAFVNGDLFEATFKRVRTDQVREDARLSKLVFKADHIDIDVRQVAAGSVDVEEKQEKLF